MKELLSKEDFEEYISYKEERNNEVGTYEESDES